jgi:hypothetical protein
MPRTAVHGGVVAPPGRPTRLDAVSLARTYAGRKVVSHRIRRARQIRGALRMAEIVLRVRLVSGDQLDVRVEDDGDESEVIERIVETLAEDSGVLRASHGDRLTVLYGRGVAAVEMAPRGAVL